MEEFLEQEAHGALRSRRLADSKRVRWDPTINLGHVLSIASFTVLFFSSIMYFNSRVVVLEEYKTAHQKDTVRIEGRIDSVEKLYLDDIKEIRKDIREILISKNRVPK